MPVSARFVAVLKSWFFSIVVAFAVLAPNGASADDRFHHHQLIKRIVVFGDSLSDPGNVFALNGGQFVAPPAYGMAGVDPVTQIPDVIPLIPSAPYKSERFSNSRHTWIELLAGAVGLGPSVKAAFVGSDGRASNYAVGGATAFGPRPVDLTGQVDNFFLDFDVANRGAPSDALYVIAIGGNDIRAALVAEDPGAVIGAALTSVAGNIGRLYGAGARKFLLWNAPDLGRTPAIRRLDAAVCPPPLPGCIANGATAASMGYNTGLMNVVLPPLSALPQIEIVQFDVFTILGDIQASPRRYGLQDATNACIQPNVPLLGFPSSPPFRCRHPEQHFFWDGIHPTRAGHRIIAFLVAKELLVELLQDD